MNNPNHKSESAKYWEEHLLSWEASAYYKEGQQNANWWDRLSTIFRGDAIYVRMNAALDLGNGNVAETFHGRCGVCGAGIHFEWHWELAARFFKTDMEEISRWEGNAQNVTIAQKE